MEQSYDEYIYKLDQDEITATGFGLDEDQRAMADLIWEQYADENGHIDWNDHTMHDSAWYYLLSEIYGYDDNTIEQSA